MQAVIVFDLMFLKLLLLLRVFDVFVTEVIDSKCTLKLWRPEFWEGTVALQEVMGDYI